MLKRRIGSLQPRNSWAPTSTNVFCNLQTTLYQQRFHELSDDQHRSIKSSAIGLNAARDIHGVADQGELEPPFAAASSGKNRPAPKLKQIAQHADDNVWGLSRRMGAKIRHFGKRTLAGWRRAKENGVRMSTGWSTIFGAKKRVRFARCRSASLTRRFAETLRHQDRGNQDRNQAHGKPQQVGSIRLESVHERVAEDRQECTGDARGHDSHGDIGHERKSRRRSRRRTRLQSGGRQRIDKKNASRERGRHGKRTEPGKTTQHRIIAFPSTNRLTPPK